VPILLIVYYYGKTVNIYMVISWQKIDRFSRFKCLYISEKYADIKYVIWTIYSNKDSKNVIMSFGTLHQAHAHMVIINKIGIQALTVLYPIPRYIRPPYTGSTVYIYSQTLLSHSCSGPLWHYLGFCENRKYFDR
jgi:hypothetical protein